MKSCLITGGGGYPGLKLAEALNKEGYQVALFDIRDPIYPQPNGVRLIKGDIRKVDQLVKAFSGIDCVYHMASYGMSGREMLNTQRIEEVNVTGTRNVIDACIEAGVNSLVYSSTVNVIYTGEKIENGDETAPYPPLNAYCDNYSRSKRIAEEMVLNSNNKTLSNGGTLHTCALRLAGIYGVGEERHLPRIISMVEAGLVQVTYGDKDAKTDCLHVDNMVQGHLKAGMALSKRQNCVAAGQAYYITDFKPINHIELYKPVIEGLGYTFPTIRLPFWLMFYVAYLIELVHGIVGRVYNFQPMLVRAEVYKTGRTHYFNPAKSKRDLGYEPSVQNDVTGITEWFKERGHGKKPQSKLMRFIVDACLAVMFAVVVLSFLPTTR